MMPNSLRNKLFILVLPILLFQPLAYSLAADTLFGPASTIVGGAAEYASSPIDASTHKNLRLNFHYIAESLDAGDSFTYGWRSEGVDTDLGTFDGLPDGQTAVPGDETGAIAKDLPDAAAVSDLVVYVKVTADSTVSNDSVSISNLTITGDSLIEDPDTDGDGVLDSVDNCVNEPNSNQADADGDDIGDVCDTDSDNDGVSDEVDNCIDVSNPDQSDVDTDGIGDACDIDADNDGVSDEDDNCMEVPNADQVDLDMDGIGDACDDDVDLSSDEDGDGIDDAIDLCFGTEADVAPFWGRSAGRYLWDGAEWLTAGKGSEREPVTMEYTYGCSGTQILAELPAALGDDYAGHYKHGLSRGLLQRWHEQNF